jgi:ketosteroid isomerase-like protein
MAVTTSRTDLITVVGEIYAAFGRGDIEAMLAPLADDISWDANWADHFGQRQGLEMFRPRVGKAEVVGFFEMLSTLEVHDFQLLDLLASDHQVVAQIVIEVSYPNGGRFRDEELHLWTFGEDGTIIALRHYVDTAKHIAAAGGEVTTAR